MFFLPPFPGLSSTVTTGNESRHQSLRRKWLSSPPLCGVVNYTWHTMGTHTYTAGVFCSPTMISPDGVMAGRGPQTPQDFSGAQEQSQWTFYTVGEFAFCGGGSSCGGMQIFSLVYNENHTVRQTYLCSYPGDRQPGSIHQDVNIVITHKPQGHKGKSVKKSYWLLLDNDSWAKMNSCWHSGTADDTTNQGGHENVSRRFRADVNICCSEITSRGFIWVGDTTAKSRVNNTASGK